MTKKNKYVQKARQKTFLGLGSTLTEGEAKGDLKKTAAYTGRDILFGAIGGGLAGAVVGRSSLLVGIAITGAGHYFGSPSAAMFGVGMMASGGYQAVSTAMNGTEKEGVEGMKERFGNFKENLKRQLFLDKLAKLKKDKSSDETTNGVGEVQYFTHPGGEEVSGRDPDFTEANHLEEQILQSGREFAKKQSVSGNFSGAETENAYTMQGDFEDKIM